MEQSLSKEWKDEFARARRDLSAFIVEQADRAAARLGFGFKPEANAPDVYPALEEAFALSSRDGSPLPVSSLFCDAVIFDKPEVNYSMRFWHDTNHMSRRLTFTLDDELELGLFHLSQARKMGVKPGTMVWDMLRIDLLGQNYLLGIANRFPIDQGRFVKDCLVNGLDEGVLLEARRKTA